ncbi:MAG TPA: penicillin-binding transpeptidase domain-containing protein, partial [Gemmatimonadaceae bacterium]|nr:penicillin-binding transpeptidase domain-containing protein [Gemmatimonadaceae bacterium]
AFRERSGIDLPEENRSIWPYAIDYYNKRFGRNWSNAEVLNLSIGQGSNAQTVVNMAKFYTALATDGQTARPLLVRAPPERKRIYQLNAVQEAAMRESLEAVTSAGGTAGGSAIEGIKLAGKTGTSQNSAGADKDHGWFVGFAPSRDPQVVVAVFLEFGLHGSRAARIASKIISHYLKVAPVEIQLDEG